MFTSHSDIIVAGGGLAGLTAALELSRAGFDCLVLEKNHYPFHKVCGEYLSNEVIPYLKSVNFPLSETGSTQVSRLQLSAPGGRLVDIPLKMGGTGLSRYRMDHELMKMVKDAGGRVEEGRLVVGIKAHGEHMEVEVRGGKKYYAPLVVGSWGKRSNVDKSLNRGFMQKRSGFMAVKFHLENIRVDEHTIALHGFPGGYCGAVQVENGHICIGYLAKRSAFLPYKDLTRFEEDLMYRNPNLKRLLRGNKKKGVLAINELYFGKKYQSEFPGLLLSGDAAGLLAPLSGNGMAMAIKSGINVAKIITEHRLLFKEEPEKARLAVAKQWTTAWRQNFGKQMVAGKILQSLMFRPVIFNAMVRAFQFRPALLEHIIPHTHGESLKANH